MLQTIMEDFLKIIVLYSGAMLTIIGAATAVLKTSNIFSRWISTKIVRNADMTKVDNYISKCEFEESVSAILAKLGDLDHIRMTIKRLEYLNVRQHNEDDEISINAIYDEYKRLGGNSYIDMDYEKWSNRKSGKNGKKTKSQ